MTYETTETNETLVTIDKHELNEILHEGARHPSFMYDIADKFALACPLLIDPNCVSFVDKLFDTVADAYNMLGDVLYKCELSWDDYDECGVANFNDGKYLNTFTFDTF